MVYILLGSGFEEAEALVAADVLRRANLPVTLAGIGGEYVTGSHDITVKTGLPVGKVSLGKGDMVVLPGGMGGVASMEGSGAAMALIRRAAGDPELWLAAICAAPTLLGRWGLVSSGEEDVSFSQAMGRLKDWKNRRQVNRSVGDIPRLEGELARAGAVPAMDRAAVTEGRLITGKGPGTAFDFALALVEALAGAEAAAQVRAGLHYGV